MFLVCFYGHVGILVVKILTWVFMFNDVLLPSHRCMGLQHSKSEKHTSMPVGTSWYANINDARRYTSLVRETMLNNNDDKATVMLYPRTLPSL